MDSLWARLDRLREDPDGLRGPAIAPGKQTLTELLPPPRPGAVQRRAAPAAAPAPAVTDDPFFFATGVAQAGVAGPGRALPHGDAVQRAFGHHDLGGVRAHVGGAAAEASRALGATAYAYGVDLAFAEEPSLALVAHEAAHVVQQRRGVALAGGVGREGDAYERHADEVAAAVVRGESVAALLDAGPRDGGGAGPAIQRQVPPRTDGGPGSTGTGTGASGATSGGTGPAAPTAASLTTRLNAVSGVADEPTARAILADLRRIAPVTGADAAPLRTAIEAHLGGDARWRGLNLVQHGPEERWPPELRGNTVAIASHARELARQGRPPAEVADALRPLDATAQQQILRSWRHDGGRWPRPADPATGQPMTATAYFDAIQAALRGPSFAPAAATGTAPILDLLVRLRRGETDAVYDYFELVYRTRGFTFRVTPANAARPTLNVINIRRHDLTLSAPPARVRSRVNEMNGQLFMVWRDGQGRRHVEPHEWSTTGPGGSKQRETEAHRDTVLRDEHLATSAGDHHGVARTAETDPMAALAEAQREVERAEAAAEAAYAGSSTRANAPATRSEAENAMTLARHADRLAQEAPGVHPPLARRQRPPRIDPAHRQAADALRVRARAAFARARDAWMIARQQGLATSEESAFDAMTAARARLDALPASDPGRPAAQQAYDDAARAHARARNHNNRGSNGQNRGEMSENHATAWLREGQYHAQRIPVHERWRYAVNGGGSGTHDSSGYAPVDRDWNANGVIDPGERDIPSTSIGSGVQIHHGHGPADSIGCQVSPDFGDLDEAVQRSDDRSGFDYVLVEAEHLPPWPGGTTSSGAPVSGGGGGAPASGGGGGGAPASSGGGGAPASSGGGGSAPRRAMDAGPGPDLDASASGSDGVDARDVAP